MDPLRIIEAAYTWEASEQDWLERVVDAASSYSVGGGIVGATFAGSTFDRSAAIGASEEDRDCIQRFCERLPRAHASSLLAPTEFAGNAGWRLERLANAMSTTTSELTNGVALPPMWALVGGAPANRAIMLAFVADKPVATSEPFPGGHAKVLGLVGAHLGAALRLRGRTQPKDADAVLSPDGRVVHATGEARTERESLSEAVLRSERARGSLRRVDAAEATQLWAALVAGRWSIVEAVESDGKRFLLARRNPLTGADVVTLDKEENDVVWLTAQGHSQKYIAYELGLSIPAVTRRLRSAMRKLGVESRRDLVRKLGHARTK